MPVVESGSSKDFENKAITGSSGNWDPNLHTWTVVPAVFIVELGA